MVNRGVSRACKTCKKRRKRCDETRPSCRNCIKARRTCLGYQDDTDLHFRRYCKADLSASGQPLHQLKETPPLPPMNLSEAVVDAEIESTAISEFLNDYGLNPKNCHSHGYFVGLETLLAHAGLHSNLAQATKIVALASIGTKLKRPSLVHKARTLYSAMLQSLQLMISNTTLRNTTETLMTAVLLGLYEIITATEDHPSNHGSHSRGIYAILSTKDSPLELLNGVNHFDSGGETWVSRVVQMAGIFCAPASHPSAKRLDVLVRKAWPILQAAESSLSSPSTLVDDVDRLLQDAQTLNEEYSRWPGSQPTEWIPRTIGHINLKQVKLPQGMSWFPERIDAYLDLYVAAVWNVYRKTRLMTLTVVIRCLERLGMKTSQHRVKAEMNELANDMAASIPFQLFQNLTGLIEQAERGLELELVPGKAIGGLLLMHPLFIISNFSYISPESRAFMKECLIWVGTNMGIGQATLLSKTTAKFPNEAVSNGYTLVWAGMLFTKSEIDS